MEGIDPTEGARYFSLLDLLKPGVFAHIYLQSKFQKAFANSNSDSKDNAGSLRLSKDIILANLTRLEKIVGKLALNIKSTTWSDYETSHSYTASDHESKKRFIETHIGKKQWGLIWDIGCNTGTFTQICAEHADYVVAIDGDSLAVEKLYQEEKQRHCRNILPLVMNLANPSPNQGWRGRERKGLMERGLPDFVICLALIHHMVISANIPMGDFLDWLRSLEASIIIEFVDPADEMTQRLLKNKADQYSDYNKETFEAALAGLFEIKETVPLKEGRRTLYYGIPK